jgi:hypothetical protein
MTGLPTMNEMAQRLIWLGRALDHGANEIGKADEAQTRAKGRYELARAKAVLKVADAHRGDKTVLAAEREAEVVNATHSEWLDLEVAESLLRKAKESQRALYAQVDLARSLNAGLKVDASLAGAST